MTRQILLRSPWQSASSKPAIGLRRMIRLAVALVAVPVLVLSSAAPELAAADEDPTAVTLALLRHSRSLCSEVGQRLLGRWGPLGGRREALQDWVFHNATGELAEARAAADLARERLPDTRQASGTEATRHLERLDELGTARCNAVAQPLPPLAEFKGRLDKLDADIADTEEGLGRLLVLAEGDLERSLAPYLPRLEDVGQAAEQERREFLDRNRPPPPQPTLTDHMRRWHAGYAGIVRPTKEALGRYLQARRASDGRAIRLACQDLMTESIALRDRPLAFRAPDPRVEDPLRSAYLEMQRLAGRCASGRFDLADEHSARMQKFLTEAAALLAPHGLQP